MAVTAEKPAPYAPAATILELIGKFRDRGLQRPFTGEVLERAGVPGSLVPRVQQSLRGLELVDDENNPTDTLEGIRRAPEGEYQKLLAEWISRVYHDVLQFAQPNDDETRIRDAFRSYEPFGQHARMVSLFMGLCRAAGLRTDAQQNAPVRPRARVSTTTTTITRQKATNTKISPKTGSLSMNAPQGLPAPLAGLLTKLPPEHGSWTQAERDRFESAFKALLDFSFTISENTTSKEASDD